MWLRILYGIRTTSVKGARLSSAVPVAWNSEKCTIGEAEKDLAGSHHTYRAYQEAQERKSH